MSPKTYRLEIKQKMWQDKRNYLKKFKSILKKSVTNETQIQKYYNDFREDIEGEFGLTVKYLEQFDISELIDLEYSYFVRILKRRLHKAVISNLIFNLNH